MDERRTLSTMSIGFNSLEPAIVIWQFGLNDDIISLVSLISSGVTPPMT